MPAITSDNQKVGPTALRTQDAATQGSIPTADSDAAKQQSNQDVSDSDKIKTASEYSTETGNYVDESDATGAAVRLLLTYHVRHNADTQTSQAAAKLLAKLDADAGVAHDVATIHAPVHDVQQNIGKGQFVAVEKKPETAEDAAKRIVPADATVNTPQIPGVDPLGHPGVTGLPGATPPAEVSINPTSQTTSAPATDPADDKR
jgi:Arc/MetJ-type ribon-helix-helix transcriptional regulator